jgi:hypothetical protein
VLQILTSDTTTCPAALILFMRARWRIENLFKYLDFYGIDYLADYHFTIQANTRKVDNPQRKQLKTELKDLTTQRDRHRERIGALHTDRTVTIDALNRQSTTAQRRIRARDKQITELKAQFKTVPAKLPANVLNPDAKRAIHRTHRRATYKWCSASSQPMPRTFSPTTSTPTYKTTTNTAPPPATCSTSAAPSPTPTQPSTFNSTGPTPHA